MHFTMKNQRGDLQMSARTTAAQDRQRPWPELLAHPDSPRVWGAVLVVSALALRFIIAEEGPRLSFRRMMVP